MVPKLNEAREMLKKYNQGDFHVLHGEIVSGIMGYFARQFEPEKEEYWSVVGMLHDIDLSSIQRNTVQNAVSFCGNIMLMNK